MKEKVLIVEDEYIEANYLRSMLQRAGYTVSGIARSVEKARTLIDSDRPGLVLLDITLSGKDTGIDLASELKEQGIAFVYLSANSNENTLNEAKLTEPYGFLVKPFRENDLLITMDIAQYRHEHSLETRYRREADLQKQLERIIVVEGDWQSKLLTLAICMQYHIPFDLVAVPGLRFLRVGFDEYQTIGNAELAVITGMKRNELEALETADTGSREPAVDGGDAFVQQGGKSSWKQMLIDTFQMRAHLTLPVKLSGGEIFAFSFYSRRPDTYTPEHLMLLNRIQLALRATLTAILPHHDKGNHRGDTDIAWTGGETRVEPSANGFDGIVGKSHLLLNVFDHMTQVAPSDTSVLILGESGTGKEMIAAHIHQLSLRKKERFVKVNCAALPPSLIESELFGHEKGSFTGALDKRVGKFEQANKGTIFLDEIGEMPLELQAKLLHVLQDREIERIGSPSPVKIDVRIIAATNRNLEKEVAEGRFRLDLYYRLNVFPILLPPLRDRKEDIPELCMYFIEMHNLKAVRKITGLSDKVLKSLLAYHWPGNIRELQNWVERSALLSKGPVIEDIPMPMTPAIEIVPASGPVQPKTIQDNERDHIISVLKKCNGRIWGPGGAAEVLNLPPTTLRSRMQKLGIQKVY